MTYLKVFLKKNPIFKELFVASTLCTGSYFYSMKNKFLNGCDFHCHACWYNECPGEHDFHCGDC